MPLLVVEIGAECYPGAASVRRDRARHGQAPVPVETQPRRYRLVFFFDLWQEGGKRYAVLHGCSTT